ncbi:MAG TPA: hypothetical protein VF598_09650 [Hymenobacter sp.]|jgi:hypothetical protein
MSVSVVVAPSFAAAARKLLKKYVSLKAELQALEQQLLATPTLGTPLGKDAYKIRLPIRSKGRGKSGSARVITYLETIVVANVTEQTVNLIYIYDKSETASISQKELSELIKQL